MGNFLFIVVSANLTLYAAIAIASWRFSNREKSSRLKLMARGLSLIAVAFVLGAATRLVAVSIELGWLPGTLSRFFLSEWQLLQSLTALGLGIVGVVIVRRLAPPLRGAERIAGAVSKQLLAGSDLSEFGLTPRELEVVEAIAAGHVSDTEIADLLYIAPATAGTHVKNILKKTGVRNRRELALLFASTDL